MESSNTLQEQQAQTRFSEIETKEQFDSKEPSVYGTQERGDLREPLYLCYFDFFSEVHKMDNEDKKEGGGVVYLFSFSLPVSPPTPPPKKREKKDDC